VLGWEQTHERNNGLLCEKRDQTLCSQMHGPASVVTKRRHLPRSLQNIDTPYESHPLSQNAACTRPKSWLKIVISISGHEHLAKRPSWCCGGTIFIGRVAIVPTTVAILIPLPRRAIDHQSAPCSPVHCNSVAASLLRCRKLWTLSHVAFRSLQKATIQNWLVVGNHGRPFRPKVMN
jgi:hypothetical protein